MASPGSAPTPGGSAYTNNNTYGNAALCGAIRGILAGRSSVGATSPLTANDVTVARAFAVEVDARINAADAQVTTNANVTMLVADTSNTIQANCLFKSLLLEGICYSLWSGREATQASQTSSTYQNMADQAVLAFQLAGVQLTTP